MARSRSPARNRCDTEWISRALVSFGRYPEKRPPGLKVDGTGAFVLDDVVRVWGRHQGLSSEDIMHAVRRHMFHEPDANKGQLRFAVDADMQGNVVIRVTPRRGSGGGGGYAQHDGWEQESSRNWRRQPYNGYYGGGRKAKPKGSVAAEKWPEPPNEPILVEDDDGEQGLSKPWSKEDKLSMSLDEIVKDPRNGWDGDFRDKRDRVLSSCEKMGLTVATMHRRQPPRHRNGEGRCREDRYRDRGERVRPHDQSPWERLSRWIGWVMKSGYNEMGVTVEDGWVNLAELAEAIGRHKKQRFGTFTDDSLRAFFEEHDKEGRFEIVAGRVRKVLKTDRQPRKARADPNSAVFRSRRERGASSDSSKSQGGRAIARSRSRSNSPAYLDEEDDELAQTAARSLCVHGSVALDKEIAKDAAKAAKVEAGYDDSDPQPPPKPPGDGWTNFKDGDVVWWYYEGKFGKWWCGSDHDEPQLYVEEDE